MRRCVQQRRSLCRRLAPALPALLLSPPSLTAQGALLCLTAATVGLGEPSEGALAQILPPVLACFTDPPAPGRIFH